jgi:hypothetical protein
MEIVQIDGAGFKDFNCRFIGDRILEPRARALAVIPHSPKKTGEYGPPGRSQCGHSLNR